MGYYIETEHHLGKAQQIVNKYNGIVVSKEEAEKAMNDNTKGVIVIVTNAFFEVAGFAFNKAEFEEFTLPDDKRMKQFVIISKADALSASGCPFKT